MMCLDQSSILAGLNELGIAGLSMVVALFLLLRN